MTPNVQVVEDHYNVFPYPTVTSLMQPLPGPFKRGWLNYLLRRRRGEILRPDADIWIAGCGTQQGIHWALCFPEATVVATDVSETALGIADGLASQLGLTNVRFEKQDLMQPYLADAFDLIVSTGVVHHLPDPAIGLSHIHTGLRPGGAALLMVYSTMHREPLAVFRRALALLAHDDEDTDARYALAGRLLQTLLSAERCSPPCPGALEQLWQHFQSDRSLVADALLHPLEQTYDIDALLTLLADTSFQHVSWLHPAHWQLDAYLQDPDLLARFNRLNSMQQANAVYHMAGYAGPLLEFLAESTEALARPAYTQDELLAMPVVCSEGSEAYRVEEGRIVAKGRRPAYEVQGEELVGHSTSGFGAKQTWRVPAYVEPVLLACDGTCTLGDILDAFANDFDRQQLFDLLYTFLPHDLGLLVPAW
ncbi:MAG TPA: class I SAM-dependent methyltransferase [Rhodothermales bacterium]|nr:class I SAM-dependent methyltransferase [Rhodothermales bacterium]